MTGEKVTGLVTGSDLKVREVTRRREGVKTRIRRKRETRRKKRKCSPESQNQVYYTH